MSSTYFLSLPSRRRVAKVRCSSQYDCHLASMPRSYATPPVRGAAAAGSSTGAVARKARCTERRWRGALACRPPSTDPSAKPAGP
eukprot:scaffold21217_cov151-Isochrysis_galbana.AAC.1